MSPHISNSKLNFEIGNILCISVVNNLKTETQRYREGEFVFYRWQNTLKTLAVDKVSAAQIFNDLVQAYSDSNRYYHTLKHVGCVLNTIQTLQAYTQNLVVLELAAWFHDVIYNTQSSDNEEKSADYAGEVLNKLGIPTSCITKVQYLILSTKYHQADDIDSQVLLDADLAILAANPTDYQEYAHAIRQEYAWVSDSNYIQGRTKVLEKFLQRQRIYFTPLMYEILEQAARDNIQAEIEQLNNQYIHG
jgi:predicted metal-dependent HD superfamily phosphohydrolase